MTLDANTWKKLYTLFAPQDRLEYHQQDLYVSRPGAVAQSIAGRVSLQVQPTGKWIVCGSMGSGKSTELVHLVKLLENTHSIVAVDMLRSARSEGEEAVNRIEPSEVLFAIGAGAAQMAREDLAYEVPAPLLERLTRAFGGLLVDEGHEIDLGKLLLGVVRFAANVAAPGQAAVAKAAVGAAEATTGLLGDRRGVKLGGLTRPVKEGDAGFEQLRIAVNDILDDLRGLRQLVVLVDGLDKINDEGRIRELFATTRILASPRAQIVYTAPIDLMPGPLWHAAGGAFNRERLTNVLVRRPALNRIQVDDETIALGVEAMKDVILRRLNRLGLTLEDVFEDGGVEILIDASGGLIRDLIHLVNNAVLEILMSGHSSISQDTARAAVSKLRKEFEITLTTQRVNELRHVREHGETSSAEKHVRELLHGGYVLPYTNGGAWFEPHPILRGLRDGL